MVQYANADAAADAAATFALREDHPLEFTSEEEKTRLMGCMQAIPLTAPGEGGLPNGGISYLTIAEMTLSGVCLDGSVRQLNPLMTFVTDGAWDRLLSTQMDMVIQQGARVATSYADYEATVAAAQGTAAPAVAEALRLKVSDLTDVESLPNPTPAPAPAAPAAGWGGGEEGWRRSCSRGATV